MSRWPSLLPLSLGLVAIAACDASGRPTGAAATVGAQTGAGGESSGAGGDGTGGAGGDITGPAIDDGAPLGASFDDAGHLQLAVRSGSAERIEAWLYASATGAAEVMRIPLEPRGGGVHRAVIASDELTDAGLMAEQGFFYGLRAWGPGWSWDARWTPGSEHGFSVDVDAAGNRFNPNKLLLDPYAKETSHDPFNVDHSDGWAYTSGPTARTTDTAPFAPKGVVVAADSAPASAPLGRPLADHLIYEVHLRGFTKADTSLPETLRGTYAGAAEKAAYLADLGVTAIELLPLHETQNQQNDIDPNSASGDNYWGYSSLSFFAPERRFAADQSPGGPTRELKAMVEAFHDAGIAVIVDVVFNHTGEGGAWTSDGLSAPFYSWRGLDNVGYYQLGGEVWQYQNDNGVGPNLAATSAIARDLVIDALRYWHEELGVDGFRFDLTPILANGCEAGCFSFATDDPDGILQRATNELPNALLIAEPWGTGAGTYQLGNFPAGWAEWNGQYRDTIRDDMNRADTASVTPGWLADRLSGSWSLFGDDGRKPWHSINFVVAHDGLTLRDLFACNDKDNDQPWPYGPSDGGTDDNRAWDQGGDPALQRQAARTGLALLLLSAGVPMITGGDEMYRSQQCNNNPYNLDSPAMWLDWTLPTTHASFHHFARQLFRFRAAHAALRPHDYRPLDDQDGNGLATVAFLRDDGAVADPSYLDDDAHDFLALRLDGEEAGDAVRSIFIAYNGAEHGIDVTLPATAASTDWYLAADTHSWLEAEGNFFSPGSEPVYAEPSYLLGKGAVLILVEK